MDAAGAQHAHHLIDKQFVEGQRLAFIQLDIVEPGRRIAVGVGHHVHQQHTFVADIRLRHADTGRGEPVQRIDFGTLPDLFLHFPAVATALFHRPGLTAVLYFPAFLIRRALFEAALVRVLVHLGATHRVTTAHNVDSRFLAAHQLSQHFVDETFFDQRQ